MKILFVCTANIVRSFMAERILLEKLKEDRKTGIDVSSATDLQRESAPSWPYLWVLLHSRHISHLWVGSRLPW